MFEFSSHDASKLHNRRLIVVLLEERPDILKRIKNDEGKTARYKAVIKYANNLIKKTATRFWNAGQSIEFRTSSECSALSEQSQSYFTLEFTSLRFNENTQLYHLKPDTNDLYPVRQELIRRKEYGFFDLRLIEKYKQNAFYTFYTPSSAPNEFDFITAIQFISELVKEKMKEPKL
ncbi:MAG TPA: hypothetical protein VK766_08355, partial [Cytophagaceae bacterium]|nr:hypothetical protein [Cytophagaceae bacterium]